MQPQSLTGLAVNGVAFVRKNYHTSSEGYMRVSIGDLVVVLYIGKDSNEDGWLYVPALAPAAGKVGWAPREAAGCL